MFDRFFSLMAVLCMAMMAVPGSAATISFAAGTAPDGVNLVIGGQLVTMTTTPIALGRGAMGSNHLQTGAGTNLGGTFDGRFFDETAHPGGPAADATRLNVGNASTVLDGEGTDFANAVGLRVDFSMAVQLHHFYFVDIDGSNGNVGEWVTSFAVNDGRVVKPMMTLAETSNVLVLEDEAISPTWSDDLGIVTPEMLDVARTTRSSYPSSGLGGAQPGEPDHQALVTYDGQSATSLFVLMGGASPRGRGQQNSGVSAFQFDGSDLDAATVPLPATAWLLIAGLGSVGIRRLTRAA